MTTALIACGAKLCILCQKNFSQMYSLSFPQGKSSSLNTLLYMDVQGPFPFGLGGFHNAVSNTVPSDQSHVPSADLVASVQSPPLSPLQPKILNNIFHCLVDTLHLHRIMYKQKYNVCLKKLNADKILMEYDLV